MEQETWSETALYLYQSALYSTPADRRLYISTILRRKSVGWIAQSV